MLLTILVLLFVLGVAFYQVLQGLYSALIMAILTVLCAALAFCAYEPIAESMLYTRQPSHADMAVLTAMFLLPLLALRLLADWLIPGNVVFGHWANRVGGGVLGLLTGIVLAGVVVTGMQMLPLGPSVMGYQPFDDSLARTGRLGPFYPDDLVVKLARGLSRGSLQSGRSFGRSHDDLLLELFCTRNTAGLNGRVDALPDALAVSAAYEPPADAIGWAPQAPRSPLIESGPQKLLVVRVAVDESARDPDNWWRLPATHFRLVTEEGKSHYPVAYLTYWVKDRAGRQREGEEEWQAHAGPVVNGRLQMAQLAVQREWMGKQRRLMVDWVYRITPEDKPAYVVFRRTAKAAIPDVRKELPPAGEPRQHLAMDRITDQPPRPPAASRAANPSPGAAASP